MAKTSELDLSKLSLDELHALDKQLKKRIEDYADKRRADALAALEAKAGELGFSLNDLIGRGSKRKPKAPARFRHPKDSTITWSGRGLRPQWVIDALAAGLALETLAI